jgi:hypothetical protein
MEHRFMMLKEKLSDWTDFDLAQYYLACSLGLLVHDDSLNNFRLAKHVFWSRHHIGDMLSEMLQMMVENDILEYDNEDQRFRWNQSFRGSWENNR